MSRSVRVAIIAAAVLIGGYAAYRGFFAQKKQVHETVAVRRGPITEVVTETGTVAASSEVDLYFKNPGRVARVLVAEGQAVKSGDALVELDISELLIRKKEAAAALSSAQAKYSQALLGATTEELRVLESAAHNAETALASAMSAASDVSATNESSLAKSYADLGGSLDTLHVKSSAAIQTLSNDMYDASSILKADFSVTDSTLASQASTAFRAGKEALSKMGTDIAAVRLATDRAEIDSLSAKIASSARIIRDAAQISTALIQGSIVTGTTTQAALDAKKVNVKSAWADLTAALNTVDAQTQTIASVKSANISALNAAEAKVATAQGALSQAKRELEARKAPLRDADKQVFLTAISSAQAGLDLVVRQNEDAILTAPIDGIVGSIDLEVGELATSATRAVSMISSGLEIEAEVSELDIASVQSGQPVSAAFDALTDQVFTGRVLSVAPRETTKDDDIYYKVTVIIDGDATGVRIGMTADLDIKVGEKADALLVPRRQTYRREGKDYVKILTAEGVAKETEVAIGLRGREDNEILSGLTLGDLVVVE